jgi:hypothetical protein
MEQTAFSPEPSVRKFINRGCLQEPEPGRQAPFSFVGGVILPDGYPYEPNLWKTKTGDLNFRAAGQTFSPPATHIAPEFSHSLARC